MILISSHWISSRPITIIKIVMNQHIIFSNSNLRKSGQLISILNTVRLTPWKYPCEFEVEEIPIRTWVNYCVCVIISREHVILSPWHERTKADITLWCRILFTISFTFCCLKRSIWLLFSIIDTYVSLVDFSVFGFYAFVRFKWYGF